MLYLYLLHFDHVFFLNLLCNSAFEQGYLDPWHHRNAFIIIIIIIPLFCYFLSLLLAFSLHFSSSYAFLRTIFRQASHLCCGLPNLFPTSLFIFLAIFITPHCWQFVSTILPPLTIFYLPILVVYFILFYFSSFVWFSNSNDRGNYS